MLFRGSAFGLHDVGCCLSRRINLFPSLSTESKIIAIAASMWYRCSRKTCADQCMRCVAKGSNPRQSASPTASSATNTLQGLRSPTPPTMTRGPAGTRRNAQARVPDRCPLITSSTWTTAEFITLAAPKAHLGRVKGPLTTCDLLSYNDSKASLPVRTSIQPV